MTGGHSPFQADIWQRTIESNHLRGHEVELVDFKHLLHLLLVLLRDHHRLPPLTRSIPRPGQGVYSRYTYTEMLSRGVSVSVCMC